MGSRSLAVGKLGGYDMWQYEKKLQFPINIKTTNTKLANFIILPIRRSGPQLLYKTFPEFVGCILPYIHVTI